MCHRVVVLTGLNLKKGRKRPLTRAGRRNQRATRSVIFGVMVALSIQGEKETGCEEKGRVTNGPPSDPFVHSFSFLARGSTYLKNEQREVSSAFVF